jgi:predicted transcriptional regulator
MMATGRYRTVRLDVTNEMYEELERIAAEDDQPMHSLIVRAIDNYLHNRKEFP